MPSRSNSQNNCWERTGLATCPKKICEFLGISSDGFTGHTMRRTAATWMADSGMTRYDMKRAGRWKSDSVVEGYVDASIDIKKKTAASVQAGVSSSLVLAPESNSVANTNSATSNFSPIFGTGVIFHNCQIQITNTFM